ncbi:MAG: hypothetical protein H6573_24535 [Lewinellaceae bacterium]|nr:hypothetical protein [Phaeodactylibacter sp.]MCB9350652.1 hypothetical protein [Lewinellaceae bacterium]
MRIFSFFALLLLLLSACKDNEDARQTLIGSWSYDAQAILDSLRIQEPTESEMAMVQGAMTIYKDAVFDFKEDGTLMVVTNGIEQSGTWEMSSNGKQMTINLSGQGQPNDILELTHERLMLAPIPEAGVFYKRIFVPATGSR